MQARWLMFGGDVNPIEQYNPLRPLVYRYNAWRMNKYISKELDNRLTGFESASRTKSVLDLALNAYASDRQKASLETGLDKGFRRLAMNQVKLFLFSGHDTTSSSVCYLFYVLSNKPSALERIRAEHNDVLGRVVGDAASLITENPAILNKLPYTLAVIKETLRLYPAVSSTRAGEPGFNVVDDRHCLYPTDGFLVWANPQTIQRDPAYWKQPDDFVPERWLVSADDPLYPIKGAWRPFEHGPRNCIGQELAMIEMKIILALTIRTFDVRPAYEEWDRGKPNAKIRTVYKERGYQIQRAQPSEDLPCRVQTVVK
jgi:sterigmatocystin biosynthesis cytochrome P450 monooxygenase